MPWKMRGAAGSGREGGDLGSRMGKGKGQHRSLPGSLHTHKREPKPGQKQRNALGHQRGPHGGHVEEVTDPRPSPPDPHQFPTGVLC